MEQLSRKIYDELDIKLCDALNDELGSVLVTGLGKKLNDKLFDALGSMLVTGLGNKLNERLSASIGYDLRELHYRLIDILYN